MSYLQQLKRQAQSLQSHQGERLQGVEANVQVTEVACSRVWSYFSELARQLNVIEPPSTRMGLDKRSMWLNMKQTGFRVDARKKMLRDKEVFDYLAIGWQVLPRTGDVRRSTVSVNFPPDLERVQQRLNAGHVAHERTEQRHPETNALLAIVFEYDLAARASVLVTADHDNARLQFRLACVNGMEIAQHTVPAAQVEASMLDELARLIVGEPSRFP